MHPTEAEVFADVVGVRAWASRSRWAWRSGEVILRRTPASGVQCDDTPQIKARDSSLVGMEEVQIESAEERAARLANLRNLIASGDYRVPASTVASSVMKRVIAKRRPDAGIASERGLSPTPKKGQGTSLAQNDAEHSNS